MQVNVPCRALLGKIKTVVDGESSRKQCASSCRCLLLQPQAVCIMPLKAVQLQAVCIMPLIAID